MGKFFIYILGTTIVSMFYFPFGFNFLPDFLNTKNLLAAIGLPMMLLDQINQANKRVPNHFIIAICFAIIYSLIGHVIVDIHSTLDLSYANYFVSFFVWTFGAYAVCSILFKIYGRINFKLLTFYLSAACVSQCILAILIDRIPNFQSFINRYIAQEQDFLMEVDRLYGIGASLDNAGVRFCTVLILIAGILVHDLKVRSSRSQLIFLIVAFFVITLIGNLISRTTFIGSGIGLIYIIFGSGIISPIIKYASIQFNSIFIIILLTIIIFATYFYNYDENFYNQVRFGFEGFFNLVEKGKWYTASTDKLNNTMWVWPKDTRTWLIGTGLFDGWIYGTDIGYCRHIMYNGLIGFAVFCLFFIYNPLVFIKRYRQYWFMFLSFMALSFIIWIKVSTDIYQLYALFYGVDILLANLNQDEIN